MRFADTPTVEVAVHIEAPPSNVWALVTDFNVLAQFSDEFRGGEWLDPSTDPGLGSRFRGSNENTRAAWEVTCTVIDWEPDRAFGWCVEDPSNPVATWRFTLGPDGSGTRLSYRARMGPGAIRGDVVHRRAPRERGADRGRPAGRLDGEHGVHRRWHPGSCRGRAQPRLTSGPPPDDDI